jgi:hypothetical protein
MSATYRIVMRGTRPGHAPGDVAHRLAELFKVDAEQAASMLAERALTIKRGVDLDTAVKYQASLEKRGCASLIEPEQSAPKRPTIVTVTAASSPKAPTPRRRSQMLLVGIAVIGLGLVAVFLLA